MANAAFHATSDRVEDGHYEVTGAQTGLDTASFLVQKWAIGADYTAPPASATTYSLINIRVNGNKLTAYISGEPLGVEPHIELDLAPPSNIPSLVIKITNAAMWDQTLV